MMAYLFVLRVNKVLTRDFQLFLSACEKCLFFIFVRFTGV
jgi:hypothetical protein